MDRLEPVWEDRLRQFACQLVDQQRARIIVAPTEARSGFWFGGGNLSEDRRGTLHLVGRYRDQGDSRTGINAGRRGWQLALFRSTDRGESFTPTLRFSKEDLTVGDHGVLSIEGSALAWSDGRVELFVSTEKSGIGYPAEVASFLKHGCGVWTIDRIEAPSPEALAHARPTTLLASTDPTCLHVKDPSVYCEASGHVWLMFCSHPYGWTSSNTGRVHRAAGQPRFGPPCFDFFPRGRTWDVAIARGTCIVDVPRVGVFRDRRVSLLFYDGGESIRPLEEHTQAVRRPRGSSCEELGGVAYFLDGDPSQIHRLSDLLPLFVSPWGSGSSRYVDVLAAADAFYVTWQQAQSDGSQPLVLNRLERTEVERSLRGRGAPLTPR